MPQLSRKKILIILLVLPLVVFLIQKKTIRQTRAQTGNTFYLATNGNNSDDGSFQHPWRTFKYAVGQLQAGDILFLRGGTYATEWPTFNSGTGEGNQISFKSYGGEEVILTGGVQLTTTKWLVFEGIVFGDSDSSRLTLGWTGTNEIAEHIIFRKCVFRNSRIGGIWIRAGRHILIEDCDFFNLRYVNEPSDMHGVIASHFADDIIIRNSSFADIGADGVHLASHDDQIYRVVIENNEFFTTPAGRPVGENAIDIKTVQGPVLVSGNTIHHFGKGGPDNDTPNAYMTAFVIHRTDSGWPGAKNVIVEKNLFYNNLWDLDVIHGSTDIIIRNNIFKDGVSIDNQSSKGLTMYDRATNIQILHNTFYNKDYLVFAYVDSPLNGIIKNNVFLKGGFSVPGSSNWDFDRGYNAFSEIDGVAPSTIRGTHDILNVNLQLDQNLKPASNSPLINAGTNVGVTEDYDGNSRPQGVGFDIGAYEYTGGVQPTGTPTPPPPTNPPTPTRTPSPTPPPNPYDLDGNGRVNAGDVLILLQNWRNGSQGDFNSDGKINSLDFGMLITHWTE